MINTERDSTLDQDSRMACIGSRPIDAILEVDILEKLQNNIGQLEELCAQLNFVVREVRSVMKI